MRLPLRTTFVQRLNGTAARGLIRKATMIDLFSWSRWQYSTDDQDRDWNWRRIWREATKSPNRYECYAALSRESLEGLMAIDLSRHPRHDGVLVDYLSANPANRSQKSGLKHVGTALIGAAILRSLDSGYNGTLWLESLAGAERFYENLGMGRKSRSRSGNVIFTLDSATAEQLLENIVQEHILHL